MARVISFDKFFQAATGLPPFGFQRKFAESTELYDLVDVPTGFGKTAMAVIGWLWRRTCAGNDLRYRTPRRLVYCLPMRVLVEQTIENAERWVKELQDAGYLSGAVPRVAVVMGGEAEDEWDIYPEHDIILVGTQDLLLSRALNRGYAMNRARWPVQFGLLNTDCLWVFDEIQLMGAGLATSAQLDAFHRVIPAPSHVTALRRHGCASVWMSATLRREWLNTVDLQPYLQGLQVLGFSCPDHTRREGEDIVRRWQAVKLLVKAKSTVSSPVNLAREILAAHTRACQEVGEGVRTLVIVNTVKKARDVIDALRSAVLEGVEDSKRGKGEVESSKQTSVGRPLLVLLHSRFRPSDRERMVRSALATPGQFGSIVVSTQVVEAGVDISAAVLFAEVAPWASLVQRFGRCNRRGEYPKASVYWIDVNSKDVHPYAAEDLKASREQLTQLERVGPSDIHKHMENLDEKQKASLLRFDHTHVIRRRDLMDLFDTTPDLTGNDIVIDHFVREREDSDVYAFWRNWEQAPQNRPPSTLGAPSRVELCSVPVDQFRDFTRVHRGLVWHWNFLDEAWESAEPGGIVPGFTYMIHTNAGGYSPERGWDPATTERVASLTTPLLEQDSNDGDSLSRVGVWQSISDHADDVCQEVDIIGEALALDEDLLCVLRLAARWHDRGKAHLVFQDALPLQDGQRNGNGPWAKAQGAWKRYSRKHFRHELASALAVLSDSSVLDAIARMTEPMRQSTGADPLRLCTPNELRDLVAYLVAAHHGKVRFSIRSLPDENCPRPSVDERDRLRRFARGLWDGDTLPETDLGGGWKAPAVCLSLEPMELGLCQEEPFVGQPSWVSRMLNLVEKLGAFQVAYLEALLRAADIRASRAAEQRQNRPFIESRH